MHLSRACRPRPALFNHATQLNRTLSGVAPDSNKERRRVPLAKDLDGISLESPKGAENRRIGFIPRAGDVGESAQYVNQMLSVRLNRRLPNTLRTGPGPARPGPASGARRAPNDQRLQQPQRSGGLILRPRGTGTGPGMRASGPARQGGKAGSKPGSPQRRRSRPMTPRARDEAREPEVPVPPVSIPSRVFDLTNLPTLASPPRAAVTEIDQNTSDIVQRVQEKIGGEYSRWMSRQDLEAAGRDDASPMARAKLALAFNSSVSLEERKKMLGTAEMLLNKGRAVPVPAASS